MNQQLLDYIKQALQAGFNKEQIKKRLVDSGWPEAEIDEAFIFLSDAPPVISVSPPAATLVFPGAITILKQAWFIYKQRLWVLIGIMAPPALLGALMFFFRAFFRLQLIGTLIFYAIGILLGIWLAAALIYAIKDYQEKIGVVESCRRAWAKILPLFWTGILASFIVLGGAALFIIPGIIFLVWFILAQFVLIAEDERGMRALIKSREYVRGNWFGVAWRFIFINVITLVLLTLIPLILRLVTVFIGWFLLLIGGTKVLYAIGFASANIFEIFEIIIMQASALFVVPLVMAYEFLVYRNLKEIKVDAVSAPTKKQKIAFSLLGILGVLLAALVF